MMMEQMRTFMYNHFHDMQNEQFNYFTTHLTKVGVTNKKSLKKIKSNIDNVSHKSPRSNTGSTRRRKSTLTNVKTLNNALQM
jgi:hypothetical protein